MTTTLNNYVDAIYEKIPKEALLGLLAWFSIQGADVPLEQARADLERLGISTATLRKRLRPIDAFKKASNTLAKTSLRHSEGIESNFLVRQVGQDAETSHRHVVLERVQTRKGKRRRLSYDQVATLVFTRANGGGSEADGAVEVTRIAPAGLELSAEEESWLSSNVPAIQGRYEHWKHHLDSHAVRTFVREYIYQLSGICVRESGGVYFVAQSHAEEIGRLAQWVKSIGSDLHQLPLVDMANQRDMLLQAWEGEAIAEVERLSATLSGILADPQRTITQKTFDDYSSKALGLLEKAEEYAKLLDVRSSKADTELMMFKRQVLQLTTKVKEPRASKSVRVVA